MDKSRPPVVFGGAGPQSSVGSGPGTMANMLQGSANVGGPFGGSGGFANSPLGAMLAAGQTVVREMLPGQFGSKSTGSQGPKGYGGMGPPPSRGSDNFPHLGAILNEMGEPSLDSIAPLRKAGVVGSGGGSTAAGSMGGYAKGSTSLGAPQPSPPNALATTGAAFKGTGPGKAGGGGGGGTRKALDASDGAMRSFYTSKAGGR